MIVATVAFQVLLMSAMMLTGYLFTRFGFMTDAHAAFLTKLLMNLLIPCMVLSAVNNDIGDLTVLNCVLVVAVLYIIMIIFTFIGQGVAHLMHEDEDKTLIFSRSIAFPNNGFIGMPLATAVFGAKGTIWCALSIFCTNIYLFSMIMQCFRRDKKGNMKQQLKSFATPLNFSTVLMLLMLFTGLRMPSFVSSYCNYFGGCNAPIAMLVVGNLLARGKLVETLKQPSLYVITLFRNLIYPMGTALVLYVLGWHGDMSLAFVLMFGTSIGSTLSISAAQYDRQPVYAGQALLHTNIFLPLTLPLLMAVCSTFLG